MEKVLWNWGTCSLTLIYLVGGLFNIILIWFKHHDKNTLYSVFLFIVGTGFDIRDFHSLILTNGAVPMSVLEMLVNEWIEEVKARPVLSGGSLVTGSYKWQIFSLLFLFIILQWIFLRNNNQLLNLNMSISFRFGKKWYILSLCIIYSMLSSRK